jgi:hypothetical protein
MYRIITFTFKYFEKTRFIQYPIYALCKPILYTTENLIGMRGGIPACWA